MIEKERNCGEENRIVKIMNVKFEVDVKFDRITAKIFDEIEKAKRQELPFFC